MTIDELPPEVLVPLAIGAWLVYGVVRVVERLRGER